MKTVLPGCGMGDSKPRVLSTESGTVEWIKGLPRQEEPAGAIDQCGLAAETDGVDSVTVPVADQNFIGGAAERVDALRIARSKFVVDVEGVATTDGDRVVVVAVPVADEDFVSGCASISRSSASSS